MRQPEEFCAVLFRVNIVVSRLKNTIKNWSDINITSVLMNVTVNGKQILEGKNTRYTSKSYYLSPMWKSIWRNAYRLEEKETIFCSKQCHNDWMHENQRGENNPNWRGGKVKYPGRNVRDYQNLRETVLKRDGFKCRICGSTRFTHSSY